MNRRGFLKFLTQSAAVTGVVLATGIPEPSKIEGVVPPGVLVLDVPMEDSDVSRVREKMVANWNGTVWDGVDSSNLTIKTDGTVYISGQFNP